MRIGFPFLPKGICSLTKLLVPLDAVVYRAEIPFFLGDPFESSALSRLLFFAFYILTLAEFGTDRLAFTSVTAADIALLGVSS